jgi:phosphoglycerate dehydrogenase-like enzyme
VSAPPAIVAAGPVAEPVARILSPYGRLVVAEADAPEAITPLLGDAVALIARGPTRVTAALLEAAPMLRVIGRTGVGADNVDLQAATARGIPVVVTPGANAAAVAEGALALLLALVKRLPRLQTALRDGRWAERHTLAPGDVAGSTIIVVGYGHIGRRMAALCRALGLRVLVHDPLAGDAARGDGFETCGLEEGVERADHLSLHVPLTDATRGLVDAALLARARPGLHLVNVSRGAITPLDTLLAALESGTLGGVGLDAFDPEPPDPRHPLFHRDDVVCTPHALALTPTAVRAVAVAMSEGMATVLAGGRAPHVANPAVYADPARSTR